MEWYEPLQTQDGNPSPARTGMHDDAEPTSDDLDALVDRIISEEVSALREAFGQGAEFAVTHMQSPRERVLHRLECPAIEPYLDRRAQWSDRHRSRLAKNRNFRPALPALVTRESARDLPRFKSCKVCWPNVHGRDPRPLRALRARGLGAHHVGHVLSTEDGSSLGTIVRATVQPEPQPDARRGESVEVVTSWRTLMYSPTERVFIWDLPTDEEAIRRKMQLFERLGTGLNPTH